MNRITLGFVTAVSAVALLTGCAGSAQRSGPASDEAADSLPAKCLTATGGAIQKLQDDIAATVGEVTFEGHGVIKSESGDDFWYIAITFDEDGSSRTGTWGTMQDPTAEDDIAYVAVDDMAPLVSTYMQPVDFAGTTSTLVGADDCIAR